MPIQSDVVQVTAPTLQGIWVHDPDDPENTLQHFIYDAGGRKESLTVQSQLLFFAGRSRPVADFGDGATQTYEFTLIVPLEGDDWTGKVQYVMDMVDNRKVMCFRDKRGRAIFGVVDSYDMTDTPTTTAIGLTVTAVEFDEGV